MKIKLALLALALVNAAPAFAGFACNSNTINNVYIPKLKEFAQWDDDQLRPFAIELCNLESEREDLRQEVKETAEAIRGGNYRVCDDLGFGMKMSANCVKAHAARVNGMIDQCMETMRLGHNPHNVNIPVDDTRVEVACLKAAATALKNSKRWDN